MSQEVVAPSLSPVNCRRIINLLSAYIDGELPGVEHRQVHDHLPQCGECEREYLMLLQMKRMVGSLRVQEPRVDLPESILRRVHLVEQASEARRNLGWQGIFGEIVRTHAASLRPVALGSGIACVAVLLTAYLAKPEEDNLMPGATMNAMLIPVTVSQSPSLFVPVNNGGEDSQSPAIHQNEPVSPLHEWRDSYPAMPVHSVDLRLTPVGYNPQWVR